jgi:metal-responsive CopG/Arc/MetJ family transcriptional regulator
MANDLIVNGKTRITIRIDNDVLEWFRDEVETAGGGSYQTMINRALREYIQNHEQFNETMLRRVIREELFAMRNAPATFKSNTTVSR